MIAVCQICSELIVSREVLPMPGSDLHALDLQNFDLLAGHVLKHITTNHDRHSMEATAVANLSAKVYAMTWVESGSIRNFDVMRRAWRRAILDALSDNTNQPAAAAVAEESPAEGTISPDDPLGSNEEKSDMKVST